MRRVLLHPADLTLPSLDQTRIIGLSVAQRSAMLMIVIVAAIIAASVSVAAFVSISVVVDGKGIIEPTAVVPIRASIEGLVDTVMVRPGDSVALGAPLVVLDSLDLVTARATLNAQYEEQVVTRAQLIAGQLVDSERQVAQQIQANNRSLRAVASLRDRMLNYNLGRNADSLIQRYVDGSHVGADLAVADVRDAQADERIAAAEALRVGNAALAISAQDAKLKELRVALDATRARMKRLVIRAPMAGIVLTEGIDRIRGAAIRAGDQLLEVGDPTLWRVVVGVDEASIHEIKIGDSVAIEVPAFVDLGSPRLSGGVVAVGETPITPGQSDAAPAAVGPGQYRVEIAVNREQVARLGVRRFRRGYSTTVKILTRRDKILRLLFDKARGQWAGKSMDYREH